MKPLTENKFEFKYIGFGVIISAVVTFISLFLIAVIMYYADIGNNFSSPLASIGLGIGCFSGGLFSAKKIGKNGLISGLLVSSILFIIVAIASLTATIKNVGILTLIHLAVMLLSGCIGGILGVNGKKKVKI